MTVEYQKVWRTMNDLELVTSKICSAREIIDAAIDRIQENQYDKAEVMMSAAYEYLEYYLKEFDDKFKLAWQATVGDLRDDDTKAPLSCDKDDPSPECKGAWNSFWEEDDHFTRDLLTYATGEIPKESQQYTEEELNAMCDKAASDQEKEKCREYNLREAEYYDKRAKLDMTYDDMIAAGYEMTADGFWIPSSKEDKVKKWVLPVEECKDVDTDKTEYFVSFPDDLLEAADLKEGDTVEWVDNGDGSYTLTKVTKPLGMEEC